MDASTIAILCGLASALSLCAHAAIRAHDRYYPRHRTQRGRGPRYSPVRKLVLGSLLVVRGGARDLVYLVRLALWHFRRSRRRRRIEVEFTTWLERGVDPTRPAGSVGGPGPSVAAASRKRTRASGV